MKHFSIYKKIGLASLTAISLTANANPDNASTNILLIVADDLNYTSVGAFGCPIPNVTPNIDHLAEQGIRFTNAHVTSAVCLPSRGAIMTGIYGFHSGVEGFEHMTNNYLTLTEYLRKAEYLTGMLGREEHSMPKFKTESGKFDLCIDMKELGHGRDPQKYYEFTKSFVFKSKKEKKPFFLMANSHDPHRPLAGSDKEKTNPETSEDHNKGSIPNPSKTFKPEDIVVPGFLPDLPEVRKEVVEYYLKYIINNK